MTYIAHLDEFGHVGPYVAREDPTHNDSPVFGLAGFIMPAEQVRGFGTWFSQRKCELLDFEIQRSGEHPTVWEKKGSPHRRWTKDVSGMPIDELSFWQAIPVTRGTQGLPFVVMQQAQGVAVAADLA